ncbi:conserved exported hypothetical protein [Capnocytophaga canimorsus]|uniref:Uncharacterized protein n=1 Tax=Capnocytophaga canimorsus TaxID=28188 RepID=A0A0B7HCN1_9FLAO|nr:DUF6607 family protein [Capnocytophaga canimorsus]ATA77077.1 hypothetical protein CGC47_05515 [Capnocytophaga canimorsus]PJI83782.1 hypothetical protein CLV61_0389 [Capnocytophaga canimorsus]CEN37466.1 conserved exported hypothetical protein [Capnocytophaga canimorsus]STA72292.1 Uncharacterised protein [Capnocytophaga canimorsus]
MKRLFVVLCVISFLAEVKAQNKKDIESIKSMCGCYEVTFQYAETFQYGADSTYVPSKSSRSKALEWVELIENNKKKLVLQHLLVVGKRDKQHVIKHWRQDWIYQNTDLLKYIKDNEWSSYSLPKSAVKGQWTQKVYQVDDSPRYEQTATWVHVDGKSFWESEADAPMPRREQEIRNDYNVLLRRNRHEITNYGWLHQQDNDKVLRRDDKDDLVIAQERGYNTYKKVADEKCKAAQEFWQENKEKWALVRNRWEKVFEQKGNLKVQEKIEGKTLYEHLLNEEKYKTQEQINAIIDIYVSKQ